MEFRQLEYILAIADEKSLTRAAEKVFVSPSALSQYVVKLENELGTPLFKRAKGSWVPTYAGTVYVQAAREIMVLKKQAYNRIGDIIDCRQGMFSVGITPGRAAGMIAEIFPLFNRRYPNVKIRLIENNQKLLEELAVNGQIDLAFGTSGYDNPNLTYQPLLREKFVLAVPKTHRLAPLAGENPDGKLAVMELSRFQDDDFILMSDTTTIRRVVNRMFDSAGIRPNILFESSSMSTIHNLVKNGYGVSLIPLLYATRDSSAAYFMPEPGGEWDLTACYLTGSYLTAAEEYCITLVRQYYERKAQFSIEQPE